MHTLSVKEDEWRSGVIIFTEITVMGHTEEGKELERNKNVIGL